MSNITILHSIFSPASRALVASLGVEVPAGDDVTVTVGDDTVRIISDHAKAVAICSAFPGYPTAVVGTGDGVQYTLPSPATWAEVTAWAADPVPETVPSTIMTHLAFRKRFTFEERTAIETAAMTDPEVRTVQKDYEEAEEIDLTYPDLITGIALLVGKGLLTQARADVILGVTS